MTSTRGAPRVQFAGTTTVHPEDNFERLCDTLLRIRGRARATSHNMPHQCDHGRLYPKPFRQVALNDSTLRMHLDAGHVFTQKQSLCLAISCPSFNTTGFDPTRSGNLCRSEERDQSTPRMREDAASCAQSAKCMLRARQHAEIFRHARHDMWMAGEAPAVT